MRKYLIVLFISLLFTHSSFSYDNLIDCLRKTDQHCNATYGAGGTNPDPIKWAQCLDNTEKMCWETFPDNDPTS